MTTPRRIDGTHALALGPWEVAHAPAGAVTPPDVGALAWRSTAIPSWDAGRTEDADEHDFFFRARFAGDASGAIHRLRSGGLATLADAWLNGAHVLRSDNMFHEHVVDVSSHVTTGSDNELVIRCASVKAALAAKRPRPRWKTKLVAAQQLRWIRTSLVGRIPAWSPPFPIIGPHRPLVIERCGSLVVEDADVRASMEGDDGVVTADLRVRAITGDVRSATLVVGATRTSLTIATADGRTRVHGRAVVPRADRWWPHTHGEPTLHAVRIEVALSDPAHGTIQVDFGKTGFRTVEPARDGFGVVVNGVPIFCRGGCWTPETTPAGDVEITLRRVRRAGMNMIRVGGTMLYEDDAFHDACDALGILVWQDFMFANMDYPIGDAGFAASVEREASTFVRRTAISPSLVVFCGGSEVEQQAAMMGAPRDQWTSPLYADLLPSVVRTVRPDALYVPSTPTGGALPFDTDTGVAHYFGVGGYLRPLADARRAGVRFAAECLAFANVPSDETIESFLADGEAPPTHPAWKARVPRDGGRGWDFDDVRDHYVRELFGIDPVALRYEDVGRYLAVGRVATAEVMARTFSEWRRRGSSCHGALVWFLRDQWPGAGWGVIDAVGREKAPYWFLRRVLAPVALLAIDEGFNGLDLHAINDSASSIAAELAIAFLRDGETIVAGGKRALELPPRSATRVRASELLEHFLDSTHAYRFGPPGFDAIVATLRDASGARLAEAFSFPGTTWPLRHGDLGLDAEAHANGDGSYALTLRSRRLALAVAIDARGFDRDDDFVHVPPGDPRTVTLRATSVGGGARRFDASVEALNGNGPVRVKLR